MLFAANGNDFTEGNVAFNFSPRFSHTYGDIKHIPSILIENHSLKPFEQRVLGTYVFLEQAIKSVAEHFASLQDAVKADKNQNPDEITVKFAFRETPADSMEFLGIASRIESSAITGREYVVWEGKEISQQVPSILMDRPVENVSIPKAYYIPAEWSPVIKKMEAHGIEMEILEEARELTLEFSTVRDYKMVTQPYEGLMRVQSFDLDKIERTITLQPGSAKINTNQALGELAVILMEPESVDSFFQWGYFNTIFTQTEYMESYIMEPLIAKMLAEDADLKKRFEAEKTSNPEFAKSSRAIYSWFYKQTPYFDRNWKVIPVGRER